MGGCNQVNDTGSCNSCRYLDVDGICGEKCPFYLFEQMGRRCLTKSECHSLPPVPSNLGRNTKTYWKAFQNQCHYDCPTGYQEG